MINNVDEDNREITVTTKYVIFFPFPLNNFNYSFLNTNIYEIC